MSRTRPSALRVVCALVATLAVSLAATATASAAGTITDAPATFVRNAGAFSGSPSANFTGVSPTLSQDHLFETGWWFRVSGDTAETFFPVPTLESYAGSRSTITWTDVGTRGLFDAVEVSDVRNTGRPSGDVTQTMTITNRSASVPLQISVFHMADFDVQPTAGNDVATLIPGTKHIRITDAGTNFAGYEAQGADNYLVRPFGASDLGAVLGNAAVDNLDSTGLPFGPGDITAAWQWSTVEIAPSASRSFTVRLSVNDASTTTTTVSGLPSPSTVGGTVKLTANVATSGGTPATAGTVTFRDNGSAIGTATVSDGVASLNVSDFIAGTHPITAVFNGTESLLASTSASVDQVVSSDADVSVAHTCTPSPVTAGGVVSCQATVVNAGPGPAQDVAYSVALPAGTTFTSLISEAGWDCTTPAVGAAGTVTCTRPVLAPAGTGAFTLDLGVPANAAPGPLPVTATAGAASADATPANNSSISTVAVKGLTTTVVASSGTPVLAGGAVTLTATVTGAGSPTGDVQFYDGATPLGSPVALAAGAAKLVTSALAAGTHAITATYAGDADNVGSTSAAFSQVVTSPPPAPAPGPGPGVTPASGGDAIGLGATPASAVLGDDGSLALDLRAKPGASGTLTVTATVPGKTKKGSRKRGRAKVVTLLTKSFVVPPSGSLPVRAKVSKAALAKLPRSIRSFKAVLTIKVGTQTVTRKFTLKRPRAKKLRKPVARR